MLKSINKIVDGVQCGLDAVESTGKGIANIVEGVTAAPAEVHRDIVGWTRGENQLLTDEQHQNLKDATAKTLEVMTTAKNKVVDGIKAPFMPKDTEAETEENTTQLPV